MSYEIRNSHGERLDHTVQGPLDGPLFVVIGHGVTANKDREWAVTLAETLAAQSVACLRFSFSGNGDSEGKFVESTISKEVEDLGSVLDAVQAAGIEKQLVYAGHSMGGAVGVLRAAKDPRIQRLISLAGMVHTADFAQRKFGQLTPDKDLMWDKPECPLSQTYMDDMRRIDSVLPQAATIEVPWLLVHGTDDSVVPLQDSLDVMERTGDKAKLEQLPGVDHVFSGSSAERMATTVAAWLNDS